MQQRLSMYNNNKLKLGIFGANCSSGRAVTTLSDRWMADWESCLQMAIMADEAGIDFMLPIGRWKGYGGDTDFQGTTFETVTWAAGLLGATKRMTVFGTVHAPLIHPIIAAKEFVTADTIGRGRFGLNVVVGWNEGEFEMFGVSKGDVATRYEYGQEWLNAVKQMWGPDDDYDIEGKFFSLKKVRAKPKPYGGTRPMIMSAGASETGRAFALKNCDALFTAVPMSNLEKAATEVADVKRLAQSDGRELGVFTVGEVVCRPTRKEAVDFQKYWTAEAADWKAVDYILQLRGENREQDPEQYDKLRRALVYGMSGFPLIGSPDDVADGLEKISQAGFDGIGFSFINYLSELPYFIDEVLPRLKRMGLRH
ncbi:LLM class flavin-dependent oxidoreductase [Roseiarcaceae bacterium H3SJ34-1]|uniref:LLM class flavin-dependent oxidoreductase n=1 Tax=Terripilifer ovatus TaxID=3032367 RepID=UPI003AB98CDD|nr:LLM class flavin-dependent oxidoreductase [Roseiarcaceae bacterium H3SJ34-1]